MYICIYIYIYIYIYTSVNPCIYMHGAWGAEQGSTEHSDTETSSFEQLPRAVTSCALGSRACSSSHFGLQSTLEQAFRALWWLRSRLEHPFRAHWQLQSTHEQAFRALWRLRSRLEQPFRAPSGTGAGSSSHFERPVAPMR